MLTIATQGQQRSGRTRAELAVRGQELSDPPVPHAHSGEPGWDLRVQRGSLSPLLSSESRAKPLPPSSLPLTPRCHLSAFRGCTSLWDTRNCRGLGITPGKSLPGLSGKVRFVRDFHRIKIKPPRGDCGPDTVVLTRRRADGQQEPLRL